MWCIPGAPGSISQNGTPRSASGLPVRAEPRGAKSTVTTWGAVTNQVLALRDHLVAEQVTLGRHGGHQRLLETLLLPGRSGPLRRDAGQCPPCQEPAGTQDRRLGCGVVGPTGRPRACPGLVRPARADPPTPGSDPHKDHPGGRARAEEIQRLEKLLEDAGIKLLSVASDITGGSRAGPCWPPSSTANGTPKYWPVWPKRRLRSKIPELTEALTGRFSEHHGFLAQLPSGPDRQPHPGHRRPHRTDRGGGGALSSREGPSSPSRGSAPPWWPT